MLQPSRAAIAQEACAEVKIFGRFCCVSNFSGFDFPKVTTEGGDKNAHNSSRGSATSEWTARDEENLLSAISEDSGLRRLGIDPNGDPIAIMLALERKMAELKERDGEG